MAFRSSSTVVVIAIVVVLLILFIFVGPALLQLDRYRPKIISYLGEKTGKEVEIGRLRLALFPLTIRVDDFALKNGAPFPPGDVVRVARIEATVDAMALLHRHVVINSLILDRPVVSVISDPDGGWNFENSKGHAVDKDFSLGTIARAEIRNAQLVASNLLPSDTPGPIVFEAHGVSGDFEKVNVDAIIGASASELGGQGSAKADLLSFGTVDAQKLSFKLQLWARQVFLADVKAEVCGGHGTGTLFFDLSGKRAKFSSHAAFSGVNVAELLEPFQNGRGKMTGRMEGELTLAGEVQHSHRPLAGIHGNGRVTVRNGEVPTLRLNENLMKLVRFNNQGPAKENPSSFNSISSDLELANLRITSKVIDIDGYGVDIDGSGSVNVDGSDELNYQGEAKITTKQGFLTNTFAQLSGAELKNGELAFAFRVGGTIESPVFSRGKTK